MANGLITIAAGILAAIALAAFAAIMANAVGVTVGAFIVAAAIGGCLGLQRVSQRLKADKKRAAAAMQEKRFAELSVLARSPAFELGVTGASNILPALYMLLMGGFLFLLYLSTDTLAGLVAGIALIVFGILLSLTVFPVIGRPVIVLSVSGFRTPNTPFVRWEEVDGIDLQELSHHGHYVMHSLTFRIPALAQELSRYSPLIRFLFPFRRGTGREKIWAVLKNTSEPPQIVYRLARLLWTARTGRSHDWLPDMPESYNAALRQLSEAARRAPGRQAFADLLATDRVEALNLANATVESARVIDSERRRQARTLSRLVWAGAIGAILYLAILLAERFF